MARKLSDLKQDYTRAGAMNELLAPCAFVSDSVVLTKRGDLFSVLRVSGVDPECWDAAQLEHLVQRFASALRILGTEYRLYQYLLKRDSPPMATVPAHSVTCPASDRMAGGPRGTSLLDRVVLRGSAHAHPAGYDLAPCVFPLLPPGISRCLPRGTAP